MKHTIKRIETKLFSIFLVLLILKEVHLLNSILNCIELLSFLPLSLLLVFVFEPIIQALFKKSRMLSCTFVYFSLLLLLFAFLGVVFPVLIEEVSLIKNYFGNFMDETTLKNMMTSIQKIGIKEPLSLALTSTLSAFKSFKNFTLSYLCAYFISLDLYPIIELIQYHFPEIKKFQHFYLTCSNAIFHYIKGLMLDLGFIFISTSSLLLFFQFSNPFVFALLIAFLNLFPYVGSFFGQLLVFLVDYVHTGQIRFNLILLFFLLQQIEANFIQPYIFKKVLNIKPIITLLSFLIFGYLFKTIGFILAPILAVIVQLAYRSYRYTRENQKVGTWESLWFDFEEEVKKDEKS